MNIQDIVRIEEDHVVIRGRQAGTIATGRIFFIPYNQIGYLGFQKEVKEAQIRSLYGEAAGAEALAAAEADPGRLEAAGAEAAASPAAVPPPAPEPKPPLEPPRPTPLKIPRKSGLLERLRARAQGGANARPPSVP